MPVSLREETARLVSDYLQHRLGGAAPAPSRAAETLRRVAGELERRERPFFRGAAGGALPGGGGGGEGGGEAAEAAALLWRVAAQMEAAEEGAAAAGAAGGGGAGGGGALNWGRVVALVAFAGSLAAALAERGQEPQPEQQQQQQQQQQPGPGATQAAREALAEALAAYLAGEKRAWLEEHGGWDGFYHFFNKHGSDAVDQNSTISNAIMAAAGFGLAGLAFLLAVR